MKKLFMAMILMAAFAVNANAGVFRHGIKPTYEHAVKPAAVKVEQGTKKFFVGVAKGTKAVAVAFAKGTKKVLD